MTRRALISVTDKTGVVEFAQQLVELGFSILSTGGTFRVLQEGGVPAVEVSAYTSFPEMMDGRVKTLHPRVHGGLLGRRDHPDDQEAMEVHGIDPIDLLAVNLYRFRETVRKPGVTRDEIVENIDIGGPAMIRSAAKNHRSVAVVVDPSDYAQVVDELRANGGRLDETFGRRLAGKAYSHTAAYDMAIARWFDAERAQEDDEPPFGTCFAVGGHKVQDLRYGENPHQRAALFRDPDQRGPTLAGARQLAGKALSYNNLLDLDAALALALEFDQPAFVVVKHNVPCGTAVAETTEAAFRAALAADPVSAFGGILATNGRLDVATAQAIAASETFVEAVVAPEVEPDALEALAKAKGGKNCRVLELGGRPAPSTRLGVRMVHGGFLVQDIDDRGIPGSEPKHDVATGRAPSDDELRGLDFAWRVCKHVKSNAIVLASPLRDGGWVSAGVGGGQTSRVDAVKIAVERAGEQAKGAVLASDAFFPFADGLQVALDAGVTAAIQPGGSVRDAEVVTAADAAGAAMVFTGVRHFRH